MNTLCISSIVLWISITAVMVAEDVGDTRKLPVKSLPVEGEAVAGREPAPPRSPSNPVTRRIGAVDRARGMLALFNAIRTSGRAGIRRPMARHDNWTWLNDNFENMILHKQTKGLIFRVVKELQEAAGK
jgi:hypothetical protein